MRASGEEDDTREGKRTRCTRCQIDGRSICAGGSCARGSDAAAVDALAPNVNVIFLPRHAACIYLHHQRRTCQILVQSVPSYHGNLHSPMANAVWPALVMDDQSSIDAQKDARRKTCENRARCHQRQLSRISRRLASGADVPKPCARVDRSRRRGASAAETSVQKQMMWASAAEKSVQQQGVRPQSIPWPRSIPRALACGMVVVVRERA